MLFNDLLLEKQDILTPAFDELFEIAKTNQVHAGDLLLVCMNGSYKPEIQEWTRSGTVFSPYSIGPDSEGHSENLHKEFINWYINSTINPNPRDEYLKEVEWSEERQAMI